MSQSLSANPTNISFLVDNSTQAKLELKEGDFSLNSFGSFKIFTGQEERFRILGDGKIGIGCNTPLNILDINGNIAINGNISATSLSVSNLELTGNVTFEDVTADSYTALANEPNFRLKNNDNKQWQIVHTSGNKLNFNYINNGFSLNTIGINDSGALIFFDKSSIIGNTPREYSIKMSDNKFVYTSGYGHHFLSGTSEIMTLSSDGKLGIGCNSPISNLDIIGGASISGSIMIDGGIMANTTSFINGSFGIGCNNPQYQLDVNGGTRIDGRIIQQSSNEGLSLVGENGDDNCYISYYPQGDPNNTSKRFAIVGFASANRNEFLIQNTRQNTNYDDQIIRINSSKTNITGSTIIGSTATINGSTTINASTTITGTTTLNDSISVNADGYIDGDVAIGTNTINSDYGLEIQKDTDTNVPILIVKAKSNTSRDGKIEMRSARNGRIDKKMSELFFSNYDHDLTSTNYIGSIACVIENSTTNLGRLGIFTYSTGSLPSDNGLGGEVVSIKNDGKVGIGCNSPSSTLEINGDGLQLTGDLTELSINGGSGAINAPNLSSLDGLIKIRTTSINANNGDWDIMPVWATNDSASNRSYLMFLSASGDQEDKGGYIRPGGSDADLINFTGQHRCKLDNQEFKEGYIVSSIGKYLNLNQEFNDISNNITINDSLPIVKYSVKSEDQSVFGVLSDKEDKNSNIRTYDTGNFGSLYPKQQGDDRVFVNSVGEGAIWVSDYNGELKNGDYITTSPLPGIGMRQTENKLMNYTVAKITMDCNFNPQQIPLKKRKTQTIQKTIKKERREIQTSVSNVTTIEYDEIQDKYIQKEKQVISNNVVNVMEKRPIYNEVGDIIGNQKVQLYDIEYANQTVFLVDENNEAIWEDVYDSANNQVMQDEYKMKYVNSNGHIISEQEYISEKALNREVYKMAFVGCTYHCG